MATQTAPVSALSAPTSPDLNHIYCCDPDRSLCGVDLSAVTEGWDPRIGDCAMCEVLVCSPCSSTCVGP